MKIESFKKKDKVTSPSGKGVTITNKNIGKIIKKAKVALDDYSKREIKVELPKKVSSEKAEQNQKEDIYKVRPQLFKPGQSGNPAGRPKGLLSWKNTIREAAMKEVELIEKSTGNKIKKTLNQIIAEKLVEKARMGDIQAIKEYGDRTDGKAHQSINVDGNVNVTERLIILPGKGDKK